MEEAIPVLRVSDASSAVAWFARFGYVQEWEHTFEPGMPVFTSIARSGEARLFLSEHTGDASPDALVHLRVEDIDAVALEFGVDVWISRGVVKSTSSIRQSPAGWRHCDELI